MPTQHCDACGTILLNPTKRELSMPATPYNALLCPTCFQAAELLAGRTNQQVFDMMMFLHEAKVTKP